MKRYPMCDDQPAQINCKWSDCEYNLGGGNCINFSPAIELYSGGVVCWSQSLRKQIADELFETKQQDMKEQPTPETVQFDPLKEWEVGNVVNEWYQHYSDWHYVGVGDNRTHIIQQKGTHKFLVFNNIRNIENIEFNASMLEVGEYIETVSDINQARNLIKKIGRELYIDLYHNNTFHDDIAVNLKGRRVIVEHKVTEA
jgi:hypothetical protein